MLSCRVCGCNDYNACVVEGVPCHWVEAELCSVCAALGDSVREVWE